MRLINARFARESKFFWNERAASLEAQTTQPIQDHAEMGYSGVDGAPDINDLLAKLNALDYYQELSAWAPKFRLFNLNHLSLYKLPKMMIRNFALFVLIGCATLAYGQSQKHPKLSTPQLVDFKV